MSSQILLYNYIVQYQKSCWKYIKNYVCLFIETDSEDPAEKKDERISSRISSDSFVSIIEEAITTFMDFLKADKENRCQIIAAFFRRRNRRASVDPTLLLLLKKVNKKVSTPYPPNQPHQKKKRVLHIDLHSTRLAF